MARRNNRRGFTLIETMVVVAVVGIIAAISWAALTPTSHQYDPKGTANLMALSIQATRMRAVSTGLCHVMSILAGETDWNTGGSNPFTTASGGWYVAQGNLPICPQTAWDTSVQFGDEGILGYTTNGANGWWQPRGIISSISGFQITKAAGHGLKDTSTWVTVYGLTCCNTLSAVSTTCATPGSAIGGPTWLAFFFRPDGTIRLHTSWNVYSNYSSNCVDDVSRFTIFVGTMKNINNNLKVVQSDSTGASITNLQYKVEINGNSGRTRVVKGW